MSFVHLHLHTPFSFLDGASRIDKILERAALLEFPALAITDHSSLSGVVRFMLAAKRTGVKPIIGAEITLESGGHLILLATTRKGYTNLSKILTHAHLGSPRKDPRVGIDYLRDNHSELIALSGCEKGEIPQFILNRRFEEARRAGSRWVEVFGRENFFLELQSTYLPHQPWLNRTLAELGSTLGIGLVATNNVHYATKGEFQIQDVLTCIRTLTTLDEPHPDREINGELYLKSPVEMHELFREFPGAISNTLKIAERCEKFELGAPGPPNFQPLDRDPFQYLRKLVYEGARSKYGSITQPVAKRLEYELSIIEKLGFTSYFLLVWDLVRYIRSQSFRYAGRGSAADSAVAYCLGITKVDPIARNLSFERFINPERANNLPDIDIDLDARYRDRVLEYLTKKYGEERVATVCTFHKYLTRGALRDVGKVLGFPENELDRIAKLIPWSGTDKLEDAISKYPELRNLRVSRKRFSRLFELCRALIDHPRHIGTHLGGVVITREPITTISPLQRSAKGINIIQFDKEDVETLRIPKLDLLNLRMLSAVEDAVESINLSSREELDFDRIPLDDSQTYRLLHSGETAGAFQLESHAQRSLQRRLEAENIDDIVSSVALIRPGPVQANLVEPFLLRRRGKEKIVHPHPNLERILGKTYGVVLFQEQVIEIAVEIGGFSPSEADSIRRAMTHHRSRAAMESMAQRFIENAVKRGLKREVVELIFSYIRAYAGYGFCEAHAAAFGDTAYKTAYLLRHYPAHFYAALLNNQPMGFCPPHTLALEARRRGIRILPPDINVSGVDYRVESGGIRVGLKQIKGIGSSELQAIVRARPIRSIQDFLEKVRIKRNLIENLVLCGAFDRFHPNRRQLLWSLKYKSSTQDRFEKGLFQPNIPKIKDYDEIQKFRFEWEILGFSPTKHPIDFLRDRLKRMGVLSAEEIKSQRTPHPSLPQEWGGIKVKAAGLVVRPQRPPTRSGRTVIFLTLEDETGLLDVTIFEKVYQSYGHIIFTNPILLVEGRVDKRERGVLIAEKIQGIAPTFFLLLPPPMHSPRTP